MLRDDFLIRLHRRITAARRMAAAPAGERAQHAERGSLLVMVLLLMLVLSVAGVTLAAVIGVNARLALQTSTRGISVYIAEAGLETALGMFRSASYGTGGTTHGDPANLPCEVVGTVDGSGDAEQQFIVSITYGQEDPSVYANDAGWLTRDNTAGPGAEANGFTPVSCSDVQGGVEQPAYALVRSDAATGEVGSRSLLAVYSFDIDTSHSTAGQTGGIIYVYTNSGLCLIADSGSAGSLVHYTNDCSRADASRSLRMGWVYGEDYKLRLASTIPADDPDTATNEALGGLCIAGPVLTPVVTTTVTVTQYRWDYKLPAGGSWPAVTSSTAETETAQPLPASNQVIIRHQYQSNPAQYRNYYAKNSVLPTAGTATTPVAVTPKTGEISRTESYRPYTGNLAQSSTSGTTVSLASPNYLRYVTATITKTSSSGGTPILTDMPSGASTAAVLVNCLTYNAVDGDTGAWGWDPSGHTLLGTATERDTVWGWQQRNSWQNPNGYCLWSGYENNNNPAMNGRALAIDTGTAYTASTTPGGCGNQVDFEAYAPASEVGAGNAQASLGYLVNFAQFGRCVDANSSNISNGLIVYPCKMNPLSAQPSWNQDWTYNEPADPAFTRTTTISIVQSGTTYCMIDPYASGVTNQYSTTGVYAAPHVRLSTNCTQSAAQWTRYTWSGRYSSSYVFVSASGRCLQADTTLGTPSTTWATPSLRGCSGRPDQKWNAPADIPLGGLGDYQEIPTGL